jgi:radical SAM superfamily enzyme YgiQ (UPF0313 family)
MKICLVLPDYGENTLNDFCCYPLGFMHVASYVRFVGAEVKVLNFNLFDYDLKEELKGQDYVFLTGYEQFLPVNRDINWKARLLGAKTVFGGALATFKTAEMKMEFDNVLPGEVESFFTIDQIPWPDYEGFGIDEYHRVHPFRYMGMLTSRGCPYSCIFCAHTCKFRERDISGVAAELDHYKKKYRVEYIVFNDNTLNVTKGRFLSVCDMASAAGVAWSAAIRADCFDEDMAVAAKNSGCQYFIVGVESLRQDRLDKMNKRLKVEDILKTLDLLHKYNIEYHGNIILGIGDETLEDITQEVEELPKGYKLFPVLAQPFAGTQVTSSLPTEQRAYLNKIFTAHTESKGKYVYEGMA